MASSFDLDTRRAIRLAIASDCYQTDRVRLVDHQIGSCDWLVATHRGLFAVGGHGAALVAHGWFFGMCRGLGAVYVFENCALRERTKAYGRIVRFEYAAGHLAEPKVLAKGLDANCHQLKIVDGLLCLIDTDNQSIRRFTLDGESVDTIQPFPLASSNDRSGRYLHINSIAQVGDRLALMLHNGKAVPERCSELAWLDSSWTLTERIPLEGHHCHDIVVDEGGTMWHSASLSGELISSDGRRIKISPERMTRGIAISPDAMVVGVSSFGPRQNRDALPGAVVVLDRAFNRLAEIELDGPPADIIAI